MTLLLLMVIMLAWAVALRLHGPFSFVAAGVFCFTVYSLPALLGLVYPFTEPGIPMSLAPASAIAIGATALAWSVFLVTIAIPVVPSVPVVLAGMRGGGADRNLVAFVHAALCVCLAGFIVIVASDGPLFFLEDREAQSESLVRMLWRWVNAVGLVAAVLARSWRAAGVFFLGMMLYFLAGDRTVLVITAFCLVVVLGQGQSLRVLFKWRNVAGLVLLIGLALFGKPIYVAVKSGSLLSIQGVFSAEWFSLFLTSFEPFITFNILDLIVRHDFQMSPWRVVEGVLGQFLVQPSAVGIDSNSFNAAFTARFAPSLTYGIAGNFWGQAWAIGGALGVAIYGIIYGVSLRLCDRGTRCYAGTARVTLAILGALFAVYAHRNSLDNLLSFVRQIFIVVVTIAAVAHTIRPFVSPAGRGTIVDSRRGHWAA